jgi:Fic family protein
MVCCMTLEKLTQKKKTLDAYRPLPPELVDNLADWFRVELTYTSNALEGNTLTRRETALVVEKGLTVGGKSLAEHLEATNHAKALDWVKEQVSRDLPSISVQDVLYIHELILKGIHDQHAGNYRSVPVRISGSMVVLPNPRKVPALMDAFLAWLQTEADVHPVMLAAEAHYQLVSIHPFVDGNGRTARLLMNLILLMKGYLPAIIRKRDRLAYIGALEKAQLGGSKDDYEKLIVNAVDRSLDIYLKAMLGEDDGGEKELPLLKIGALAKRVGESNATIRYWTQEGLLVVTEITASGYQLYHQDMVTRVAEIHALKEKRLTLKEIKAALS